jgi:aminoglycoside phosphotransferase (APT) family kinase protein
MAKYQDILPGGVAPAPANADAGIRVTDDATNATPWRRDASRLHDELRAWARAERAADVTNVRLPGNGMSSDTVLFCLDGEPLVARLAPAPDSAYATFPTYDLDFQRRVIELVRSRTGVPAPEVVHFEESADWLGVPFMVVRAVDGVVPSDNPPYLLDPNGWFRQGTAEQWARFEQSTIRVLVELHRVADDGDTTRFLHAEAAGETALAQLLASHHDYYEWARDGRRVPVLERAHDVLSKTLPPTTGRSLLWGDARPGNIIYRDFEPVAVLDWEMAGVGPPECDVAWTTFFQRFWAHFGDQFGLAVPAMFEREATAADYARLGGAELDDLAWYEALAGYRFGIILMRMSFRNMAYSGAPFPDDADDLILFAPLLERLITDVATSGGIAVP